MAAFTFEKISPEKTPPEGGAPLSEVSGTRHRGVIVQIFGRLAEARIQRKAKTIIADKGPDRG